MLFKWYTIHNSREIFVVLEMNHIFRQLRKALVQTIFTQYVNKQKRKKERK